MKSSGWNKKAGEIKKYYASEDELWSCANYFFSDSCRKTSTYQFGILKSIMDSLFSGKVSNRGIEMSFQLLFSKFAENYWNLVTKYHLRQMRYNGQSDKSKLEQIFDSIITDEQALQRLEFDSLNVEDKNRIVSEVLKSCKANPIGALYNNFDGMLYGFDIDEEILWLNPVAYEFLLKYKFELEKLNYYSWARYLEKINEDNMLIRVLEKLEDATPKRNDLSLYRNILKNEFEINTCFYCGKKLTSNIEVDHIIPWKLVREDKMWNFVLACKTCNGKKNDRVPDSRKLLQVIDRNEKMAAYMVAPQIEIDFEGYSADMLWRLWSYAKIGGYKEFSVLS